MQITDEIATYAAIVSTGSVLLQAVLWWRSGPHLSLSVMPNAVLAGGAPHLNSDRHHVVVTARNRGDRPTTIRSLCFLTFRSSWHRWRLKPELSFVVVRPELPGYPPSLPKKLDPGEEWMGLCVPENDLRALINAGRLYAAVYAGHRDKPTMAFIRPTKVRDSINSQETDVK